MSNQYNRLLLINILNNMYNDNLEQIRNLNTINDEIRRILVDALTSNLTPTTDNDNDTNVDTNFDTNVDTNFDTNRTRNTSEIPNENNGRFHRSFRRHRNSLSGLSSANSRLSTLNNLRSLNNRLFTLPSNSTTTNSNLENSVNSAYSNLENSVNSTYNLLFPSNFLEPVRVFPSREQINYATRVVRFGDILSPINRSCPISIENFDDNDSVTIIRFCRHIFNTEHLNTWFQTNYRCPVCRYDIRNFTNTNNDNTGTTLPVALESATNFSTNNLFDDVSLNLQTNTPYYDTINVLLYYQNENQPIEFTVNLDLSNNII